MTTGASLPPLCSQQGSNEGPQTPDIITSLGKTTFCQFTCFWGPTAVSRAEILEHSACLPSWSLESRQCKFFPFEFHLLRISNISRNHFPTEDVSETEMDYSFWEVSSSQDAIDWIMSLPNSYRKALTPMWLYWTQGHSGRLRLSEVIKCRVLI